MLLLRNVILGLSLLCISACGFEPMYGERSSQNSVMLKDVSVNETTNSRESAILKAKVEELFYRDAKSAYTSDKPYSLVISLIINKKATIVETDGEIQRYRITISSPYKLVHKTDGTEITTGSIQRIASYNTSDDNYAEYITSEDIVTKAVAEIAEEYALRLGAKLVSYQQGK